MIRTAASKVAWVGRTASMVFGLALVMALVLGVASMALGANGQAWILGQNNVATAITRLAGPGGVQGPMMQVVNNDAGTDDTALDLRVQAGEAPMRVNRATKVANLNSDKVDNLDSTALLPGGDLPRGRTVRGSYDIRDYAAPSSLGWDSSAISFGYRLASSPTGRIIKAGATAPAQCPGTVSSPEAAPGYLCVYEATSYNLHSSNYPATTNVSRNGASLFAFSTNNGNSSTGQQFYAYGTWAVTGN